MIAPDRLGHVALTVVDLERSLAFYRDILGLVVSDNTEIEHPEIKRGAWLRLPGRSDHHCLALFELKRPSGPPTGDPTTVGMHHFALATRSYPELVDAYRTLRANEVEVVGQRQYGPGSQVRLYCLDPDGNRVELYWDLDQIGWDGAARPPLPIEEVDLESHDIERYLAGKRRIEEEARGRLSDLSFDATGDDLKEPT